MTMIQNQSDITKRQLRSMEREREKLERREREKLERRVDEIIETLPARLADQWRSLEEEFQDHDRELGFDTDTRICLAYWNAVRIALLVLVERGALT